MLVPPLILLLSSCVAPTRPDVPARAVAAPPPFAQPARSAASATGDAALLILRDQIAALGRGFDGVVGIAVRDVRSGWSMEYNGAHLFPQQSVSKLWVAITVLDAVDRGTMRLSDEVLVRPDDLTLFHQPIAELVGPAGFRTTVSDLLARAMTMSDNSANDRLLWLAGGPQAVRAKLARAGIANIRFGPGERLLQSGTAGLAWRQDYSTGRGFDQARGALPPAVRTAALDAYLADPPDGAAPDAVAGALARLDAGSLLSAESTQYLLALMAASRTGPQRMRGGLAPGWTLAHKTGTGQELDGLATGYNDVGLLTGPNGETFAVAVMIASTRRAIPDRQRLMSTVVRCTIRAVSAGAGPAACAAG